MNALATFASCLALAAFVWSLTVLAPLSDAAYDDAVLLQQLQLLFG